MTRKTLTSGEHFAPGVQRRQLEHADEFVGTAEALVLPLM